MGKILGGLFVSIFQIWLLSGAYAGDANTHYVDRDGDSFGTGARYDGIYAYLSNYHFGDKMDLDDEDPEVNTLASAELKYGSFQVAANVKAYLRAATGVQVGRVFFVSNGGNDATAQVDNINLPWKRFCTLVEQHLNGNPFAPQAGDAIVVRAGLYQMDDRIDMQCYRSKALSGTPGKPIVVTGLPEAENRAMVVNNKNWGIAVGHAKHIILRNFISTCVEYGGVQCRRDDPDFGHVMIHVGDTDGTVIEHNEGLGSHWGIWGGVSAGTERNMILRNNVMRDMGEHGIYLANDNNGMTVDSWIVENLSFRNGRTGFQVNGLARGLTVANNKFFQNVVAGMSFTNGIDHSWVVNNFIYGNSKSAIVIFTDNASLPSVRDSNDNNVFINNTVVTGRFATPRCESGNHPYINTPQRPCWGSMQDPSAFPAINIANNIGTVHRNNAFVNNILVTWGGAAFGTDDIAHVQQSLAIFGNLVDRMDGHPANGVMARNSNGLHTSTTGSSSHPYQWSIAAMESGTQGFSNTANTLEAGPEFKNFQVNDPNFVLFPQLWDFDLRSSSPAIDYGTYLPGLTPLIDITRLDRSGYPDLGAYEH